MRRRLSPVRTTLGAVLFALVAATACRGQTAGARGGGFQQQFQGVSWSGKPLREALESLSRTQNVAILLDRRVDPGQELDLQLGRMPLAAAIGAIAESRGLEVSLLGSVAYLGPRRAASRLRTVAALRSEEIRRLPAAAGRKFAQRKALQWSDFATPRELIEQLGRTSGLRIVGLEQVPHDLWAAAELPAVSLIRRLTLILCQFDLTFEVAPDGSAIRLIRLPDEVALVRSYPGGRNAQTTARRIAAAVPNAQVKVVGGEVYVKGLLEDHERIGAVQRPRTERPAEPEHVDVATQRFTLNVKNESLEKVFRALDNSPHLKIEIDREGLREAGFSLDQRVSFSVKDATIDELLGQAIKNLPLKVRRVGNVVEISPLGETGPLGEIDPLE